MIGQYNLTYYVVRNYTEFNRASWIWSSIRFEVFVAQYKDGHPYG